ncbi:MAG TPA: hypothetical protein VMU17_00465, partial [Elusimicrobiota bacterium]|nr:hypothetical protein [Elusimicrobiota bacterium]
MLDKIFRAGLLLLAIALPLSIGASSSLFFPLLGIWLLGAHWTWKRWPPTRGSPEKAYWVFLSVSLVSALLGNDPMHSLHEIYKKDFYIFIAVLVAALVRDRDQANRLLRAFLVAGILSAVWGLIQYVIGVDQTDRSGG